MTEENTNTPMPVVENVLWNPMDSNQQDSVIPSRQRYARTNEESWMEAVRESLITFAKPKKNGNRAKWMPRFLEKRAKHCSCRGRIWYGSGCKRSIDELFRCSHRR